MGFLFFGAKKASKRIIKKGENKLKIICVDDHRIILSHVVADVKELLPDADVVALENAEEAMLFAKAFGCDILFTEIELYGKPSGIELARYVQGLNPKVNIIFTTVCSETEYAGEVMELRPSAYLKKVVTKQDIENALQHLLYKKD